MANDTIESNVEANNEVGELLNKNRKLADQVAWNIEEILNNAARVAYLRFRRHGIQIDEEQAEAIVRKFNDSSVTFPFGSDAPAEDFLTYQKSKLLEMLNSVFEKKE